MKRILFITVFTALILLSGSLIAQSYIGTSTVPTPGSIYHTEGDLGIGTTKPGKLLHLYKQENVSLRLERPFGMMYEPSIWDIENSGSIFFKNGTGKLAPETKFTFSQNGTLTATKFIGDGSQLTELPWAVSGTNTYCNTGNVGIGSSTPVYKFEVIQNSSDWASYIYNSSGSGKGLRVQSGYQSVSDATILQLEDAESNVRFKVLSNGNVGIGTTNPSSKLTVNGTLTATEFIGDGSGLTNLPVPSAFWSNTGDDIYYNAGNVGIGTDNPSSKLEIFETGGEMQKTVLSIKNEISGDIKKTSTADLDFFMKDNNYSSNIPQARIGIIGTDVSGIENDAAGRLVFYTSDANLTPTLTERMRIDENGNVGIGTDNPQDDLTIWGYTEDPGGGIQDGPTIELQTYHNSTLLGEAESSLRINNGGQGAHFSFKSSSQTEYHEIGRITDGQTIFFSSLQLYPERNNNASFTFNDYTGLRTMNADIEVYKGGLEVDYNVGFNQKLWVKEEIIIQETCPFPDYVFNKDYELISLPELKQYIAKHNRLPEVPSAEEVAENGLNVGEMNVTLLKKIEELTLYTLEQQELIEELRKEVDNLKEKE